MKSFVKGLLFGAVLSLAAAMSANATILFTGAEDIDFNCTGSVGTIGSSSCTQDTNTGRFRTAFARSGLTPANNTSAADPPANLWKSPNFTATTHIWTHFWFLQDQAANTSNNQIFIWYASDGNPAVILRGTGSTTQIKVSTRSTTGTLTDLVTCSAGFGTQSSLAQYDIDLNYAVAGGITIYKNSASLCTFSGDMTTNSRTQLQAIALGPYTSNAGAALVYSEVIVADADTRGMSLVTMLPGGAGNATAWTGTNGCTSIINNNPQNTASFISSSTSNQLEQCTVKFGNSNTSFPTGSWAVDVVATTFSGLRGTTGPQHIEHNLRTGGVDSNSADVNVTTSFGNYQNYWTVNPNGSTTWAQSDLTAAGFNIGVKSTP